MTYQKGDAQKERYRKRVKTKVTQHILFLVIYFIIKAERISAQSKANRSKGDKVIQNLISFIEVRIQIQRKLHQIWIQIQRKLHQIEIQIQRKLHQNYIKFKRMCEVLIQ